MTLKGIVQHGDNRGKALGFPTANLQVKTDISDGIYLSVVTLEKVRYPALTFIGVAETVGKTVRTVEIYILSFDRDIYGKELEVTLLDKLRENQKFSSEEALVRQMKRDTMVAQSYFRTHPVT